MDRKTLETSVVSNTKGHRRQGRAIRIVLALICTLSVSAAPVTDASARGFGGFGGGFFGHSRGFGAGFGHGGPFGHSGMAWGGWHRHPSSSWSHSWRFASRGGRTSKSPGGNSKSPGGNSWRWGHRPRRWGVAIPIRKPPLPPWDYSSNGGSVARQANVGPTSPAPTPQSSSPAIKAVQRAKSGVPSANEQRFVPDEVLFTVNGSNDTAAAIAGRHHLTLLASRSIGLMGATVNRYRIGDTRSVPVVIRELEGEQQVAWAQPNYIFSLEAVSRPIEGLAAAQYAIPKMHLIEAHRLTEGERTRVAIIDSSVDETHPDLEGAVADHVDLVGGTTRDDTHGTAIASIIAAHGMLLGVAPHASLLIIRAFSDVATKPGAEGTTTHILAALDWAYQHKARVVNMSFAGPYDPLLAQALAAAHRDGMILVAAAGNGGAAAGPAYPAADPNVIAVTATDRDDKVLAAANRGTYICLAAPGTDIVVAAPGQSYQFSSGTSLAAAHVTGLVALLLSEKPDLSAARVRRVLVESAQALGKHSPNQDFGAGLANALKAIDLVKSLRDRQVAGKSAPQKPQPAAAHI